MKKVKSQSLSGEVRDEILKYIRKIYDGQNTKLPTEEQFSEQLGVSRITIRTALNDLANEGFIFRRQGKGTFVNAEAISMKVPFTSTHLYQGIIQMGGYEPGLHMLPHRIVPATAEVAQKLRVPEGTPMGLAPKVFYASGTPCAYMEDFFCADILHGPEEMAEIEAYNDSLFSYLDKKHRRRIVWDRTDLKTVTMDENAEVARQFAGNPAVKSLLLLDCVNFDQNDEPLMYAKEYVDTAFIQFNTIRYKRF